MPVGMCVFKCASRTLQLEQKGTALPVQDTAPDKARGQPWCCISFEGCCHILSPVCHENPRQTTGPLVRPQHPLGPGCLPVENIVMLYSSFLPADVDSLYDKATLQSLFRVDFALRGSW